MGYSERYPALVAELVRLRGSIGVDRRGDSVPALTGDDMVGVLALYTRGLRGAIDARAIIVASAFVAQDGRITVPRGLSTIEAAQAYTYAKSHARTSAEYLAAQGHDPPYRRFVAATAEEAAAARLAGFGAVVTFEPARDLTGIQNPQLEQIAFLRDAIREYDSALQATTAAFALYGAGRSSLDAVTSFLLSIRPLGSALDVMAEQPPVGFVDQLRGALKASAGATGAALEAGAGVAGDVLGSVANTAGNVAGQFAEGFFSSANILTLVIAGVIAYKVIL